MHDRFVIRRAISPIIATVLIIAVTLIAAVAIGGFVFGIFGTASQSAQIGVTETSINAGGFASGSTAGTITCQTTAPAAGTPYIVLTNTGTASAQVTGLTITWGGGNNQYQLTASTSCAIGGAGSASATTFATFVGSPGVTQTPTVGATYSGSITLSNGAQVLFTGAWQ